ncbi:hypothetical protein IJJ54_02275 [Candidatus Saccharibacteria bacterium]|nr:hypothetical protein [Candidatus Saccharibacteria bacterium]
MTDYLIGQLDPKAKIELFCSKGFLSNHDTAELRQCAIEDGWLHLVFADGERDNVVRICPVSAGQTGIIIRTTKPNDGSVMVDYRIIDTVIGEAGIGWRYRLFTAAIEPSRVDQLILTADESYLVKQDFICSKELRVGEGKTFLFIDPPLGK